MSDSSVFQAGQSLHRRDVMRAAAATATVSSLTLAAPGSPVERARAIPPAAIPIAAAAPAAAYLGWSFRDHLPFGSNDPPEGLTADGLAYHTYSTIQARQSTNASTFMDNKNIADGITHSVYSEAKQAAIDAINDEASDEEVQDAALSVIEDQEATILGNIIKSWNESVRELQVLYEGLEEHEDIDQVRDHIRLHDWMGVSNGQEFHFNEKSHEFPNGEEIDLMELEIHSSWYHTSSNDSGTEYSYITPVYFDTDEDRFDPAEAVDGRMSGESRIRYLQADEWTDIYDRVKESFSTVKSNISTWTNTALNEIEAGEIDTSDLLTSRELSDMYAEDEDESLAIADLMALNASVDLERESVVKIIDSGLILEGALAITGDRSISAGDVIDPDEEDQSFYLTYDVTQGRGEWSDFDEEIVDGELVFTSEPYDVAYTVETDEGSVTLSPNAFNEDDGEWAASIGSALDADEATVEEVTFASLEEETEYETVLLDSEFEVLTFTDSEGNEHDSASFESFETHDDDNYITAEEWDDLQEQQLELIEKYHESQEAHGGGGGGGIDRNTLFLGGGIIALVGMIIAALSSGDS